MVQLLDEAEIQRAITEPPTDTRAYFRGRCLSRYAADVAAASWDSVIFDVGRESLQRIPMMEPLRGTKAHVDALLERSATAAQLVDELTGTTS
jgi:proteasome accessory factor A